MKIVLDTNVLVSGIFFKGPPYQILKELEQNRFQLIVTHEILTEYETVINELQKEYPILNIDSIWEKIILRCEVSFSVVLKETICIDPDDDKFFACAIASKSNIIVSGDKHLLTKSGYKNIIVLKPKEFLNFLLSK